LQRKDEEKKRMFECTKEWKEEKNGWMEWTEERKRRR
jgi:hypothetical protein